MPVDQTGQKEAAARRALEEVRDGMALGLGSGSTAAVFVRLLGERVRAGLRVVGVPTSQATAALAAGVGIPLAAADDVPELDLDVDGADEVDPEGRLLKGLGGALLREKIVAAAARRLVIVVDEGKLVSRLGERAPLPVEVVRFGWRRTEAALRALGVEPVLRMAQGRPFVTDGGNLILDCRVAPEMDLPALASRCKALVGVVEHGLFPDARPTIYVGCASGGVERRGAR
jgi:ribose 5-phosphate isomerase A